MTFSLSLQTGPAKQEAPRSSQCSAMCHNHEPGLHHTQLHQDDNAGMCLQSNTLSQPTPSVQRDKQKHKQARAVSATYK